MRVWPRLQVLSEAAHGTLHCRFAHEAACAMGCALQRMPACARSPAHCMPPWEQSPPARVSAGRGSGALSPPCTARSASSSAASTRAAATCASACRAGGGCRAWARCASCSLCRSSKAAWARRARTATRRSAAACLAAAATWCWRRRRVRGPPAAPALPRASPATGRTSLGDLAAAHHTPAGWELVRAACCPKDCRPGGRFGDCCCGGLHSGAWVGGRAACAARCCLLGACSAHSAGRQACLWQGLTVWARRRAAMPEIPFGEYFSVETRWDVVAEPSAPDGPPRCRACPSALSTAPGIQAMVAMRGNKVLAAPDRLVYKEYWA